MVLWCFFKKNIRNTPEKRWYPPGKASPSFPSCFREHMSSQQLFLVMLSLSPPPCICWFSIKVMQTEGVKCGGGNHKRGFKHPYLPAVSPACYDQSRISLWSPSHLLKKIQVAAASLFSSCTGGRTRGHPCHGYLSFPTFNKSTLTWE